jgi:hypothetical protein|tara:strand:+ start:342 stop:536 length:195 start_codon:yes stop_codon:yes gene_type:complete
MEVYFEDSDYDIPEIEVEIVLVLANFGSVDLQDPGGRRKLARALHHKLFIKNYISREVMYEEEG